MAELAFKVKADYDEVVSMREELARLRGEMIRVDTATEEGRMKMAQLEHQYSTTARRLDGLVEAAAKTAVEMKNGVLGADDATIKLMNTIKNGESAMGKVFSSLGGQVKEVNSALAESKRVLDDAVGEWEARLVELNRERTLADVQGDNERVEALDEEIKKMQESIESTKEMREGLDAVSESIADQVEDLRKAIQVYEDLADEQGNVVDVTEESANAMREKLEAALQSVLEKMSAFETKTGDVSGALEQIKQMLSGNSEGSSALSVTTEMLTKSQHGLSDATKEVAESLIKALVPAKQAKVLLAVLGGNIGLAAVIIGVNLLTKAISKQLEKRKEQRERIAAEREEMRKISEETRKETQELERLSKKHSEAKKGTDSFNSSMKEINKMAKEYHTTLLTENDTLDVQIQKYKELAGAIYNANVQKAQQVLKDSRGEQAATKVQKKTDDFLKQSGRVNGVVQNETTADVRKSLFRGGKLNNYLNDAGGRFFEQMQAEFERNLDVAIKNGDDVEAVIDSFRTRMVATVREGSGATDEAMAGWQLLLNKHLHDLAEIHSDLNEQNKRIEQTAQAWIEPIQKPSFEGMDYDALEAWKNRYNDAMETATEEQKAEYEKALNEIADYQGKVYLSGSKAQLEARRSIVAAERDSLDPITQSEEWKRLDAMVKQYDSALKGISDRSSENQASLARQRAAYTETIRNQQKEDARQAQDYILEGLQAELDARKDSERKVLAQMELDYKKEKQELDRWYEDLKDEKIRKARELFEANPANSESVFTYDPNSSRWKATEEEDKLYQDKVKALDARHKRDMERQEGEFQSSMDDYLIEYGNRKEKELAITRKYNRMIEDATAEGEKLRLAKERDEQLMAESDSMNEFLLSYGTFQERYQAIQNKYARERGKAGVTEGDRMRLNREESQALNELQQQYNSAYHLIFADAGSLSETLLQKAILATQGAIEAAKDSGDIQALTELYARLREQMSVMGERNRGWGFAGIAEGFGLKASADEKRAEADRLQARLMSGELELNLMKRNGMSDEEIEKKRKKIEELRAEINRLREDATRDDENALGFLEKGFSEVASAFSQLGGMMASFRDGMGGAADTIAEIGEGLAGLAGHASDIQKAFEGGFSGGNKAQGIAAAIQGTIELIGMVGKAIQNNKKAQEEWNRTVEESEHRLKMLELDKLDYSPANIFGVEDPFKKATDSAEVYRKSMEGLSEITDKLANGQVQIDTKNAVDWANVGKGAGTGAATGAVIGSFFGPIGTAIGTAIGAGVGALAGAIATKTVPVFESLKDHYGELFDPDTYELNPQLVADYDKLDEDTKQIVDHWDEIKKKAKEARQELKDNLSEFTGDLGKQLEDMLVNAWTNNRLYSAVDDFRDYVGQQIASILQKKAFAAIFEDMFTDLEQSMVDSFIGPNADGSIIDDLSGIDISGRLEAFGQLMEQLDSQMQEMGYEGFRQRATNANATTGSYQQISETTGSAIQGGVTALRLQGETRNANLSLCTANLAEMVRQQMAQITLVDDIRSIQAEAYLALVNIRDNTAGNLRSVQNIEGMVDRIEKKTREL